MHVIVHHGLKLQKKFISINKYVNPLQANEVEEGEQGEGGGRRW